MPPGAYTMPASVRASLTEPSLWATTVPAGGEVIGRFPGETPPPPALGETDLSWLVAGKVPAGGKVENTEDCEGGD